MNKVTTFALSVILTGASAMACDNHALQTSLTKEFSKYKNVTVEVDDCTATFGGKVDRLTDKIKIEKRARDIEGLSSVYMQVTVGGPDVPDAKLAEHVAYKLRSNPETTGGDIFNTLMVNANNGAITLSGLARTPMIRDEVVQLVASTKGVKDVVDNMRVDALPELLLSQPRSEMYSRHLYLNLQDLYVGPMYPW